MPDDLDKPGKPERNRINIHEDHELRNWAHKLNVSLDELKEAVKAAGDRAEAVKEHLSHRRSGSEPRGS